MRQSPNIARITAFTFRKISNLISKAILEQWMHSYSEGLGGGVKDRESDLSVTLPIQYQMQLSSEDVTEEQTLIRSQVRELCSKKFQSSIGVKWIERRCIPTTL